MKKVLFFAVALTMVATSAMAATPAGKVGIGFIHYETPLGVRIVMNEKVGLDLSFGFGTENDGDVTNFNFMGAVPISLIKTEKANFNVMPGFSYMNMGAPSGSSAGSASVIDIFAALEVEFFLTESFAVNANHGFAISMYDSGIDGADSSTDFGSFGNNWTNIGFHFYLPSK